MDHLLPSFLATWEWLNTNLLAVLVPTAILVATGASRSLGGFFSSYTSPLVMGWWYHRCASNPHIINITLNIIDNRAQVLHIDTIMADKYLREVWKNQFIAHIVSLASKRCTALAPVVEFKPRKGWRHKLSKRDLNDIYRAVYNPLISQISEKTNNIFSFMKAAHIPMRQYDFVVALTYEKGIPNRDEHFRCMTIWAETLENLPTQFPVNTPPYLKHRFETLHHIRSIWKAHPERLGVVTMWLPESWAADAVNHHLPGLTQGS